MRKISHEISFSCENFCTKYRFRTRKNDRFFEDILLLSTSAKMRPLTFCHASSIVLIRVHTLHALCSQNKSFCIGKDKRVVVKTSARNRGTGFVIIQNHQGTTGFRAKTGRLSFFYLFLSLFFFISFSIACALEAVCLGKFS